MNMKIWRAKAYLRLSKEDLDKNVKTQESDSIVNQRDLICDFLKSKEDISYCGERYDDGVSGVSFDRPAFNALMDDIRDGSIDCIIVKDLSRFGRNHFEAGNYIENIFPLLGVRFIAINDGIDTANPKTASDNIIIPFKNLINDAYCRDISIKIRSQFAIKRKRGQFVGAFASYGYLKSEECKNKLVIDENVADYVREIFRMKISGMSAEAIATKLNAMGIPSPLEYKRLLGQNYVTNFKTNAEAKWSATAVLRILRNPVYIGTLTQGKEGTPNHKIKQKRLKPQDEWVTVENSHDPIVSLEMFRNAATAMKLDTRTAPHEDTVYLFSGILYCGHCGYNIIRKTVPSVKKKYIYYVCGGNKKTKACTCKGMREEVLTDIIFTAIKNRIDEVLNIGHLLSFIDTMAFLKIKTQNLNRQLTQKQAQQEQSQRFKKCLYEAYIEGTVSKNDYDVFYADYSRQYEDAQAQIDIINNEIDAVLVGKDENALWMENFKQHRNITELNRAIVVELIDRIIIYDSNVLEITFRYQSEYDLALQVISIDRQKDTFILEVV